MFVYIFRSDSEDCNTRRSGSGNVATASALGLVNIGGVFVVLLVGMYAIKFFSVKSFSRKISWNWFHGKNPPKFKSGKIYQSQFHIWLITK